MSFLFPADSSDRAQTRDGRNVDEKLGALQGEGAHQDIRRARIDSAFPLPEAGRGEKTAPTLQGGATPDYYGQPLLKETVWTWMIPAYFFVGGLAGASSAFGGAVQLFGGGKLKRLERQLRWVGAAGDMASAALLIADLGRPARFLNMLRVFRPTSPMNVGTWILSGSGACNTVSALLASQERGPLKRIGDAASLGAGVLGVPLAGYTAVLLSNTAVPVWQHARRSLPLLFTASSVSCAGALMQLLPGHSPAERRAVRLFAAAGMLAELAAGVLLEREAHLASGSGLPAATDPVAKPLHHGASGALWKAAKVLTVGALALTVMPQRRRTTRFTAGALGLAAGLCTRFAIFHAGKKSARDPQASFQAQRAGMGAAELAEAPRSFRLLVLR